MPLYLDEGELVSIPKVGRRGYFIDADGTLKELKSDGSKAAVGGISLGPAALALARAQQLCGTGITKVFGSDFDNDQWYRFIQVNTGAPAVLATERGGVLNLPTGAGASSFAVVYPHGTTVVHFDNPATSKWYVRARIKFTTAVDAQAQLYMGFATAGGGAPLLNLGLLGNLSTGFISGSTTNNAGAVQASFTSTVAFETTAYHVAESWSDSINIGFAWDGAALFSTPVANIGTNPVTPTVVAGNGTTAANRAVQVDYLYTCMGDP